MRNSNTTAIVRVLYFKQQDLIRIHSKLTFNTLHSMVFHLKANATSVLTTLGGGAHGYVGEILPPVTYTTLSPITPFTIPTHPILLNLAAGAAQYVISNTQTVHSKHLHTFQQYQLVKRVLLQ